MERAERLWRELNRERGYREVRTPILYSIEVWERSGHWEKYRENMFTTYKDERLLGLKPMNCPGHVEIFAADRRSYRDLPLRLAEQGLVHRDEPSGALHGLMRVIHITQDDAHIFCTAEQVEGEVIGCLELARTIYDIFGLPMRLELSTRPENRIGDDALWDAAEGALTGALARVHGLAQYRLGCWEEAEHAFLLCVRQAPLFSAAFRMLAEIARWHKRDPAEQALYQVKTLEARRRLKELRKQKAAEVGAADVNSTYTQEARPMPELHPHPEALANVPAEEIVTSSLGCPAPAHPS